MISLASRLHSSGSSVLLAALEHRYYGLSYPAPKATSWKTLEYLSSFQAVSDVASFAQAINLTFKVSPKWVTYGGSYPGMISAWSRLLFPSVIHAAVSSSSPVQAQLDMGEYNDWTARTLTQETVGGSKECLARVEEGHEAVAKLLAGGLAGGAEDRKALAEMFNVCDIEGLEDPLEPLRNRQLFAGDGLVFVPSQSNDPACASPLCNIESVCASFLSDPTEQPLESLARVAAEQRTGNQCVGVDWAANLSYLSSEAARLGGTHSWLYQTCNEFGFYQTCETGSGCPYAKGYHPLDQDLEMCSTLFGIDAQTVEANVANSLAFYGGWSLEGGTRILSVNGNIDPWSTLAVTDSNPEIEYEGECLPAFWVDQASHHFW